MIDLERDKFLKTYAKKWCWNNPQLYIDGLEDFDIEDGFSGGFEEISVFEISVHRYGDKRRTRLDADYDRPKCVGCDQPTPHSNNLFYSVIKHISNIIFWINQSSSCKKHGATDLTVISRHLFRNFTKFGN